MTTADFAHLVDLLWSLLSRDPAIEDPGWEDADPTGFFVRFAGLQQPVVDVLLQEYGLSSALFTNAMPRASNERIDVPAEAARVLEMPPEVFMRMGFAAAASRGLTDRGVRLGGTMTTEYIQQWSALLGAGIFEHWPRFCELATCPAGAFKRRHDAAAAEANAAGYELYRLNLLRKFPLIDTGRGRFVAPDPELIQARTTLGVYYDLLRSGGKTFADSFGDRFSNLAGDLLRSACGTGRIWSASPLRPRLKAAPPSKNADHIIFDGPAHVLVECKALRPNAQLLMLGDPREADAIAERLAGAVDQVARHSGAIREGRWASEGLPAKPGVGIIVTYGRVPIVDGSLFRDNLRARLAALGSPPLEFLVLSLSELDSFLRLVELGNAPMVIIRERLSARGGATWGSLGPQLRSHAMSRRTRSYAIELLGTLWGAAGKP